MMLLLLAGMACADVLPPSGAETQGITVSTDVVVVGDFKHENFLQWIISSEYLNVNVYEDIVGEPPEVEVIQIIVPEPPLNMYGEVQSSCTYSEDTIAKSGTVAYSKESSLETDAFPGPGANVRNDRQIYFSGYNNGRLVSSEDMTMHNYGTAIEAYAVFKCPFAAAATDWCTPAFCNSIEAGSVIDSTIVSAVSTSEIRNVNPRPGIPRVPPVPVADNPAEASYRLSVREIDPSTPTEGLVSAYTDIGIREGRPPCGGVECNSLFEEIKFEESRSMKGEIDLFEYVVTYESGIVR